MILVYAGRRIDRDDPETPRRFPLASVPRVTDEVAKIVRALTPTWVVGSAACGADLLVLAAAERLQIRRRVVLPFDSITFRATSVVDCPGDWGARFDTIIRDVSATGDLVELRCDPKHRGAYQQTNAVIFREAQSIASELSEPCGALVLWNRNTRGTGDVSEAFLNEARRRGWHATEIDTAQPWQNPEAI